MKHALLIFATITISWVQTCAYEIVELLDGSIFYGNRIAEDLKNSFIFLADSAQLQLYSSDYILDNIDNENNNYILGNIHFINKCAPTKLGIKYSAAKIAKNNNPRKEITIYDLPKLKIELRKVNKISLSALPAEVIEYIEMEDGTYYEGQITCYDYANDKYVMNQRKGTIIKVPISKTDKRGWRMVDINHMPNQYFEWFTTVNLNKVGEKKFKDKTIEGYLIELNRSSNKIVVLSPDGNVKKNVKKDYITSVNYSKNNNSLDSLLTNRDPKLTIQTRPLESNNDYWSVKFDSISVPIDSTVCAVDTIVCPIDSIEASIVDIECPIDSVVCEDVSEEITVSRDMSDKLHVIIRTVGIANKQGTCFLEVIVSNPTSHLITAPLKVSGKGVSYSTDLYLAPDERKTYTVPVNNIVFQEKRAIKVQAGKKVVNNTFEFSPNLTFN